jgi:predicted PurR-regulated permease PerM
MTNNRDVKILIVLVSILVIIALIFFSLHIQNQANALTTSSFTSRKNDLQNQQTALESAIADLNNTLQKEKIRQQALANEIAAMNNQSVPTTPSTPVVNPPVPKPTPAPTPAPVTRAS